MTETELPDAELDVMGCLWTRGPLTAREIREALSDRRPMHHASVCTLLKRLEQKRFVAREKSGAGKSFRYRAVARRAGPARRMLDKLLDRVFGGNGVALVASLLETRTPTKEELDEMQKLLDETRQRQKSKRRPS